MAWADAKAWTASLNAFGTTGWRLPTMIDTGQAGCEAIAYSGTDRGYYVQTISLDGATVFSELAHLFHVTLGNQGGCDTAGDCSAGFAAHPPDFMMSNKGDFRNLQSDLLWTGLADVSLPGFAWNFATNGGYQSRNEQDSELFALAVRAGDVTVTSVPEPQSLGLVLLAIGAGAAATRRRKG